MSQLEITGLRKRYGAVAALDGVDLAIAAGSRTAIVGPSGSGKSTLLRMVAGFDAPDSGRILLDGEMLADGPAMVAAHRRGIGVVAQDGALFPHLSIADNIGYGLDRRAPGRARRIADLMAMVGLDGSMLVRRPDALSGGQQQRVALARALARQPRLMLLDEPFSALDTGLRASTRKAVADLLGQAGITTILVTHDQAEALSFADQVGVMRDGRLLQVGPPRTLYLEPRDPMIAEFMGEAIMVPAQIEAGWAVCPLGRVPVAHEGQGSVTIMLRPEQILLDRSGAGGIEATITAAEFGGAVCSISISLAGLPTPIILRRSAAELPAAGTSVSIRLIGKAHVFAENP